MSKKIIQNLFIAPNLSWYFVLGLAVKLTSPCSGLTATEGKKSQYSSVCQSYLALSLQEFYCVYYFSQIPRLLLQRVVVLTGSKQAQKTENVIDILQEDSAVQISPEALTQSLELWERTVELHLIFSTITWGYREAERWRICYILYSIGGGIAGLSKCQDSLPNYLQRMVIKKVTKAQ